MKLPGKEEPVVFVVDDDAGLRDALRSLLRSAGFEVLAFQSGAEFLAAKIPDVARCMVLDVRLPGLSGLDFQSELAKVGIQIPIIFITAHGDIPMSVRAMKAGAIEFLTKPFHEQELLDAVEVALARDRADREGALALSSLKQKYELLTPREQEVMGLVSAGLMNKQIAGQLGVTEITVKIHRGNVMRKMAAKSLADLVRMAGSLQVVQAKS